MDKSEVARKYLAYLESGNTEKIVGLFHEEGTVDSPLYGIKKADEFYHELDMDTANSQLQLKGIFEQSDANSIALYFTYKWTLKNDQQVDFDVVDIIEFDSNTKIKQLKIIYDTVGARTAVEKLNKSQCEEG